MKKQLYDASMQINIVNEILANYNYAVNALMKLQLYGITEQQILNLCRSVEANDHNLTQINFGLSRNQGERLGGRL